MAKASSSKYPPPSPESDSDSDYSSSSDEVEEDEFGEELTPALDAAILKTLGKIKRREGVYSGENVLQEALKEAELKAGALGVRAVQKAVAEKPYLLADHHRAALLEGKLDDDDEEEDDAAEPLTNVQEQRILREGAINAFKSLAGDGEDSASEDEEAGFLLKPRSKEEEEMEQEDEEYRKFLLDMGGGEEEVRKILGMGEPPAWRAQEEAAQVEEGKKEKKKKKKQKDAALSHVEKEELDKERREKKEKNDDDFLMNYILNRGWIDRSEKHVPTYDEVVGKVKDEEEQVEEEASKAGESSHPWGVLEEDEFDEQAEEFETAYNFRYEEPGSSNILSHPREIPSLVRRADDTRKTKRQAREERKAAERAAMEENTRRLKGQKRREMEAQIKALKKELGEDMDWSAVEKIMEGEWDEAEWERVIGKMLNDAADKEDEERPTWDDLGDEEYDQDEEGDGGYDQYAYGGADEEVDEEMVDEMVEEQEVVYEDDGPINMDADFEGEQPEKNRKKDKKGKKGKEREVEVDEGLTVAERAEKVKQALDEYKALDHEDMIGDMPTRFKYTKSAPVNFGLTPVEILLATDAELNALAGVRHIAPYRRGGLGKTGQGLSKRIRELKGQLRARRWGEEQAIAKKEHKERQAGSGSNLGEMGKKRKWGGDAIQPSGEQGEQSGNAGTDKSNGPAGRANTQAGPKKRLGKKQRMRAKLAEEAAGAVTSASGITGVSQPTAQNNPPAPVKPASTFDATQDGERGDGESKKKRRKKKKSGTGEAEP